ncbi:hypothetical protein CH293_19480 [Rhodococcus sp. 14-2470-1b]|nr:hypothetical protein CH293_19480 [Rhodococcus sp. 14-2470-1b]
MAVSSKRCRESGETVRSIARTRFGLELPDKLLARFEEPGWYYDSEVTARCVCGEFQLHCLRRPYVSAGKEYRYVGCVCTSCCRVHTLADLGIGTYAALLGGVASGRGRADVSSSNRKDPNLGITTAKEMDTTNDAADVALAPSHMNVDAFQFELIELEDAVSAAIASLPDKRDQQILSSGLGLSGHGTMNMSELGVVLEISRERVRQLRNRAVNRLNRAIRSNNGEAWRTQLMKAMCLSTPINYLKTADRLQPWVENLTPDAAYRQVHTVARIAGVDEADADAIAQIIKTDRQMVYARARRERGAIRRADLVERRIVRWLDCVEWPERPALSTTLVDHRQPTRDVRGGESVFLETFNKEIQYESGLERLFLQYVDESPLVIDIASQPCRVPYSDLHQSSRTYHPDFLIRLRDGEVILVEIKGTLDFVDAQNLVKYSVGRAYAHQRGWGWLVLCPHTNITIQQLRARPVPNAIRTAFQELLAAGPLSLADFRCLYAQQPFSQADLLALILTSGWKLQHAPFRLSSD